MLKAIQIIAVVCLLAVGSYMVYWYVVPADKVVVADKCKDSICFGLNWRTATEKEVRDWLKSTSDVNAKDGNGATPLHWAAIYNENPAIISTLLKAKADVMAKDKYGLTPLRVAMAFNEIPAISKALVKAEADVVADDCDWERNICFGLDWQTVTEKDVRDWLKSTGDVAAKDENGHTPLHYAVHAGYHNKKNQDIPFVLTEAGADIAAKDKHGHTPFYYAILALDKEKPGTIKALTEAGRDLGAGALSTYQDYTIKSQATSALAEITPGKTGIEVALTEERVPSLVPTDEGFIGLQAKSGTYCGMIALISVGFDWALKCTIANSSPIINALTITWNRDILGEWSCTTTILESKHRPGKCH